MPRTAAQALDDIAIACDRVASYVGGKSPDDLLQDPMIADAVERCIERISEASRFLPAHLKALHPTIPWPDIAAIGNRIRHACFAVNAKIIWQTATIDLPTLRAAVEKMRAEP